jgi:uncharacterized membrane protein YbhN (UPF0104 family)
LEAETSNGIVAIPPLWGWQTLLSGLATLAILAFLATTIDWPGTWREFLASHKGYVLLGGACHYLTYPVRGARWRLCLSHLAVQQSGAGFGLVVFFQNFVDNVVPAKLGDVYGAHLARINFGVRRSKAIGSIVFQRMIDSWIVLFLSFLACWTILSDQLPSAIRWVLLGGCLIAVLCTGILFGFFLLDRAAPSWLPGKAAVLVQSFRKGMWPGRERILPILGFSVLIWLLETLWVTFLIRGFGTNPSPGDALFLTMVPLLATAFPLTPSGAGAVELTLFSCLRVVGVDASLAGSITLLNRFIDYWSHIGAGILLWFLRERLGLRTWREWHPAGDDLPQYRKV